MDNLFLPREVGSIETGPQTFAGTDVLNTTFVFRKDPSLFDPPGTLNSVLVENAGQSTLNGIFDYVSDFNDRPYYIKDSNPDYFILWFENQWQIYDFLIDVAPIYYSIDNVPYPWHVLNWEALNIAYNPIPTVSKVL